MTEPVPNSDVEREALTRACPRCDAHPGEWCASVRARNDYLSKLHAARLLPVRSSAHPAIGQEAAE